MKKAENRKQTALDEIRMAAQRDSRLANQLHQAAKYLAHSIVRGEGPKHDHKLAVPVRNLQGNVIGRFLGPRVTRDGVRLSRRMRRAYAVAAITWANALLSDESSMARRALDRVDVVARAIGGVPQGVPLTSSQLQRAADDYGGVDQMQLRTQTLVYYLGGAPVQSYAALSKFDEGLYDEVLVEVESVNFRSHDDDSVALASRTRRDSDWVNVIVDGEVVGVHRVFGANTWDLDDWVDPKGFLRDLDGRHPMSLEDWAVRQEEQAAARQAQEERKKARWRRSREAALASLPADVRAARLAEEEKRYAEKAAAAAAARREAALKRAEAERLSRERTEAFEAEERERLAADFSVRGSHRGNEASSEAFTVREAREEEGTALSGGAIYRIAKKLESTVAATTDRVRQLQADAAEVRRFALNDTAGLLTSDLIEETVNEFSLGIIADDDLDLDKALTAVPALANHVRDHKRMNKMPRGLMGALASARREDEAIQAALKRMGAFRSGVADLEAAVAGL